MANDWVPESNFRSAGIATVTGLLLGSPESRAKPGPPVASSSMIVVVTVLLIGSGTYGMGRVNIMSRPVLSTSSIDALGIDLLPGGGGIAPLPLVVSSRLQTLVSVQVISNTCFEMLSSIK